MNLKDFLTNRDKPPELYWSLVLEPGWVQAGVWYIGETAAEVISFSPPTAWSSDTELIGATDAALSSAIQKLPENYKEPDKTVFGVPSSWVKGGEISEEYLAKIKKICTELSLNPVGFVVLTEAIAHLYKSEENAPLSAIIIGLAETNLDVSIFKLGNLIGTTSVARSVSLIDDITEGLSRFDSASPLPSRFIIFDGKGGEMEEAKETLMQAPWVEGEKVKFLHTPKAEILSPERKVLAACLAGAAEIGNVTKISSKEEPQTSEVPEADKNIVPVPEDVTPESLGFALEEDVSVKKESSAASATPVPVMQSAQPVQNVIAPVNKIGVIFEKAKNNIQNLFKPQGGFPRPVRRQIPKGPPVLPIVLIVLLLAAGIVAWWFGPKADVTIFVTPKSFQEETTITFSTTGQFDQSAHIVPAEAITAKVSGEKTKATSGIKLIGEKAKGTVQIANGNSAAVTLAAGTILTSSGSLKFMTNSEASISGQLLPGSPGTATLDITAGDIGAQYNLAKGEVYSVGNYLKSLVAATSTSDFSGGSSQQISAVSKDDQTTLEKDLKTELESNALSQLAEKVNDNQMFINSLAGLDVASENFDRKVGDSTDTLKLILSIDAKGVAADREKLLEFAGVALTDKIPAGFVLRRDQIDFSFTYVDQKDDNYNYKVTLSANFLPKVDIDSIIEKISGRTKTVVEQYLNSIPGFSRAEVTLKPKLPGFLGTLPRLRKNITVEISAER